MKQRHRVNSIVSALSKFIYSGSVDTIACPMGHFGLFDGVNSSGIRSDGHLFYFPARDGPRGDFATSCGDWS
jgi:hypothetical protein